MFGRGWIRPSSYVLLPAAVLLLAGSCPSQAIAKTCSGTLSSPGVLVGVYHESVSIEGVCDISGAPATVEGNLTVTMGSSLNAAYQSSTEPYGDGGTRSLTVIGNMVVDREGTALLGCDPGGLRCIGAEEKFGSVEIEGNLQEKKPLGVVMHNSIVQKNVSESGGGGGVQCEFPGPGLFGVVNFPVYSDYEDSAVGKNLKVGGLRSCWLGVNRVNVGHNVTLTNNQLAEAGAITVLSNVIGGNLKCERNSAVWDSSQAGGELYPREPEPNTVDGRRSGQCVLASPEVEGGAPGPGPF